MFHAGHHRDTIHVCFFNKGRNPSQKAALYSYPCPKNIFAPIDGIPGAIVTKIPCDIPLLFLTYIRIFVKIG